MLRLRSLNCLHERTLCLLGLRRTASEHRRGAGRGLFVRRTDCPAISNRQHRRRTRRALRVDGRIRPRSGICYLGAAHQHRRGNCATVPTQPPPPQPGVPPGFYLDSQGVSRRWDGQHWTGQVQPPPQPGPPPQPVPPKKKAGRGMAILLSILGLQGVARSSTA